jgi:hypothetical protein
MSLNSPRGMESEGTDDGIYNMYNLKLEQEENVIKPNQWGTIGARIFKAFSVTHEKLPPGCYGITIDRQDDKPIFVGRYIKIDKIMRFKGELADKFLNEIDDFWNKQEAFKKNGFLHRRGYMLYGAQGVGKSSIVWQVMKDVVDRGGIVLICDNPKFFTEGLKNLRQVEPKRPIVCVFEDIDAIIKKYGDTELLSILDGDSQIDRVINIATTNYPELLDRRIINRPRRFDRIYKILPPSEKVRIAFLKAKLPKKENLNMWVKKTKGLSFAALAESLISVLCLDNDLDETVNILTNLEAATPTSSDNEFGGKVGFGSGKEEKVELKD